MSSRFPSDSVSLAEQQRDAFRVPKDGRDLGAILTEMFDGVLDAASRLPLGARQQLGREMAIARAADVVEERELGDWRLIVTMTSSPFGTARSRVGWLLTGTSPAPDQQLHDAIKDTEIERLALVTLGQDAAGEAYPVPTETLPASAYLAVAFAAAYDCFFQEYQGLLRSLDQGQESVLAAIRSARLDTNDLISDAPRPVA
jgi:hypothetical protein